MWSVVCVFAVIFALLRARARSGMSWGDFLIVRGAFVYGRFLHRWSCKRYGNFPETGPAIIVCNHTCSADGAIVLAASERPVSFLVAGEHFNVHPLAHRILEHLRCIPVKRTGNDPVALRRAFARLAEGHLVCLFPEGNLSGVGLGRWRFPKPGAALLALRTRLPVFPVFIHGGPRTDDILPSWLLPTRQAVRVIVGKPIDLTPYFDQPRSRRLIEEVSRLLMNRIEALNPRRLWLHARNFSGGE